MGAKDKILEKLRANVSKLVGRDDLRAASGNISDWARSVRSLRQEGWKIETVHGKNPGYILHSLTKGEGITREYIDQKTRYRILQRDESKCRRCGRTPADGVKLHVDHKIPVDLWDSKNGDVNQDSNLWTLCSDCNEGKKAFFSDQNPEEMRKLLELPSGSKRLKLFFQMHKGELLTPDKLQIISGIRDWTREIRMLRAGGLKIRWVKKYQNSGKEGYILD